MEIDDFDIDESALAEAEQRREQKLADDEIEIEAINDCESGACAI